MYGSSDVCSSDLRAGPSPCLPKPEAPAPPGPRPIMAEKARVGVLISGRGSNMAALLYASRQPDCPYEIALVASNNPDAAGLKLAEAEEVATFALGHKGMKRADYDRILDAELAKAGAQYVALGGHMRLLSAEFVEKWEGRMINIHPSLLPKHKGLDTHARALEAGDKVAGCSVHLVTVELDSRSEEHTSELQSLMRISYAVFCLKKKT